MKIARGRFVSMYVEIDLEKDGCWSCGDKWIVVSSAIRGSTHNLYVLWMLRVYDHAMKECAPSKREVKSNGSVEIR